MRATDVTNPEYYHRVVDCQWACPAHTPVPEYIRRIAQGDYQGAYLINWKSNVFPGILGRTCDRPCEPACRRGRLEEQPVAICRLKRVGDVLLEVGGDAFQPTNGDRLLVQPPAPAGRLAWAIAGAAEDAGEDVGLPVDQIGALVVALSDAADVLRDRSVRGTGPLAIDDSVIIVRIIDVSRPQDGDSSSLPRTRGLIDPIL